MRAPIALKVGTQKGSPKANPSIKFGAHLMNGSGVMTDYSRKTRSICCQDRFVTRFYRTDPNRTSGKIKLTPPVDSYTIVLQVLTLSTTQTTRGWFLHTSFLGGVECSNGGFRPCEGPGLARVSGLLVDSLIMLARRVLC